MKTIFNRVKEAVRRNTAALSARFAVAKSALKSASGEGYVDTAVKILMAVVIGALVLGGLYALFGQTVLPTLVQKIKDMFGYSG
jgi:hypothetical protein